MKGEDVEKGRIMDPEHRNLLQENYPAHEVQKRQGGTGVQYVPNNVPFDGTSAYAVRSRCQHAILPQAELLPLSTTCSLLCTIHRASQDCSAPWGLAKAHGLKPSPSKRCLGAGQLRASQAGATRSTAPRCRTPEHWQV